MKSLLNGRKRVFFDPFEPVQNIHNLFLKSQFYWGFTLFKPVENNGTSSLDRIPDIV